MPRFQFTLRSLMIAVAVAAFLSPVALELFEPGCTRRKTIAIVSGLGIAVLCGVGAMRAPWIFFALALAAFTRMPTSNHSFNAQSTALDGCVLGWIVGAPLGKFRRSRMKPVNPFPAGDYPRGSA